MEDSGKISGDKKRYQEFRDSGIHASFFIHRKSRSAI